MNDLTPAQIVEELDNYVIGQDKAKRMVAVAMRNRLRRRLTPQPLRDEIAPKNIIMIGPTGVGKTEIARRLAKLAGSPFVKVEAVKFTEVGYVGRDVESIIRDLMEIGVGMVRTEEMKKVRERAEAQAEERLLDLLLPGGRPGMHQAYESPEKPLDPTREKFRELFRKGELDERRVEIDVAVAAPQVEIMAMPGMEEMGSQFRDMFSKVFPEKKKRRSATVKEAFALLTEEEAARLVDPEKVGEMAKERVEQSGVVFLDEIDKIVGGREGGGKSPDVSREGVQRDLLPIVEGSVVNTKHGMVKTDHILFIAAGAFAHSKPSDLIPELQGRFPLRVELESLGKAEFVRILTEPKNALTVQYRALLSVDGVDLDFTADGVDEMAAFAEETNRETENIGARRLYTILEKILADLSFSAPFPEPRTVAVDRAFVREKLADVRENRDLSRYIL